MTTTGPTAPAKAKEELEWYTPTERCDQCNAQSYYMAVFDSGNLFFCYHHFNEHSDKIFESALDVVDESELL